MGMTAMTEPELAPLFREVEICASIAFRRVRHKRLPPKMEADGAVTVVVRQVGPAINYSGHEVFGDFVPQ